MTRPEAQRFLFSIPAPGKWVVYLSLPNMEPTNTTKTFKDLFREFEKNWERFADQSDVLWNGWVIRPLRLRFDADVIIHSESKLLFAAELHSRDLLHNEPRQALAGT